MSTEVATKAEGTVAVPVGRPDWMDEVAKSKEWLGYIEQAAVNNKQVVKGIKASGHFYHCIRKDEQIDLGKEFDALVCGSRPKAIDFRNMEKILSYYNVKDEGFQKVKDLSGTKDSGCMFGPAFLLWIPKANVFSEYLYANISAKNQAGITQDLMDKWVTYKHKAADNAKGAWNTFTVTPCSMKGEAPDPKRFAAVMHDWDNPPVMAEKADAPAGATADGVER